MELHIMTLLRENSTLNRVIPLQNSPECAIDCPKKLCFTISP